MSNDNRNLKDGIYDMDDDITFIQNTDLDKTNEFKSKNPEWVSANAYETECEFILSRKPKPLDSEWSNNWCGSGFNYGSTNILKNCPKNILILAEND